MAKHGKKKIRFHAVDLNFASFFLDYIRNKDFYTRITGSMNYKNMIEFTLVGSPDSVRNGILKIKKFYHKARKEYDKDVDFIHYKDNEIDEMLEYDDDEDLFNQDVAFKRDEDDGEEDEDEKLKMDLKMKKLKFDAT